MSEENVVIGRRAVEALNSGDIDAWSEAFDPAIEWEETASLGPDAATYRGVDAVREAVASWLGMWSDYEIEGRRFVDVGEDVVVLSTERGVGRDSGVAVERELGAVYRFRDGKVVRARLFGGWAEALEAAGLSE